MACCLRRSPAASTLCISQVLLDRGLGAAGVAIAPAPVKGILFLPLSTLRVSLPALSNPANNHRAVPLTADQFHYAFTNNLSEQASLAVYERYAAPGPDHLLFQAAFANFNPHAATAVDFHNDHRAPLLLISGGNDHVSPASVVEANFKLYDKSKAVTEYKNFAERTHYTLAARGRSESFQAARYNRTGIIPVTNSSTLHHRVSCG